MISSLMQKPHIKLTLIVLLALILRLTGIASRPIWYDEAFSSLLAEQGPGSILNGTLARDADTSAAEEHPPAYYFMLWGWIQIFGNSLIAIRMLSVFLSLGITLYIYQIASHLLDPPTALTAAFLTAILPFQVHYGQEIRMYVLLTFLLCITTLAFLKRQWILFSIAAALAQYTHTLAAFYLIPLAFTPILQRDWKTLRVISLAGCVALIIYAPWLVQLPSQLLKVTSSFWVEKPGVEKFFTLILLYLPHLPLTNNQLLPALMISALTVALAFYQTIRHQKEDILKAKVGFWLAYLAFMPPLLLWLVSQISPIYVERALLPSHAIFCIWLAWAFKRTNLPRPIQYFALILILTSAVMGFYQHITYKGFPYGPFASLDQDIRARLKPGDVIVHSNKLTYLPSFYFDRNLPQSFLVDPPGSTTDTLSPTTRKILELNEQQNIKSATDSAVRVWFIIYQQSIDEFKSRGSETIPEIEYLKTKFELTSTERFDDIWLYCYIKRNQ